MREVQDHYFRQAKREGFRARAAYKLIEIDERRRIFKRGDRVLDCGAAPGSWMQVAAQRVGPRGCVVGIDLSEIEPMSDHANVTCIRGDLAETPDRDVLAAAGLSADDPGARFDVVISDMAPSTSGDRTSDHHRSARLCELVLSRAASLLKPGGNLVMKMFEGERSQELIATTKQRFERVKAFKPGASRSESFETYVIALGYRDTPASQDEASAQPESDARPLPPNVKRGWGSA